MKENKEKDSGEKIDAKKGVFQSLKEEQQKKQQEIEDQQLELQKQVQMREKQKREEYEKKLMEERRELMRLKQGVIEESELIPEDEPEEEIKLTVWGKIKNFFYHNKWWLGLACFVVLLGVYLIVDIINKPRPDMVVLLIGEYPSVGQNSYLSDYIGSFAEDFNGNGKTEVDVYYIDYQKDGGYANYANGADTKLTTEMQIGDAVIIIAGDAFKELIEDDILVDLSEMYPDNSHVKDRYFYLKDTDFAKHIGVAKSDIPEDMYIALRTPKKLMYSDTDDMQETYDKDLPVFQKLIEDLSK